ncbi:CU044_5270 family protein [Asanoa sp. NPDC049573]|uniref:CU044_5270 family protein n=1 Tax=Asanoa sp. NPDC049573 TaxID=3155396 RepID=UPI0034250594
MTTHRDALRELAEARPARLDPDAPPADPVAFTAHPQATRGLPTRRLVLAGGALVAAAAVAAAAVAAAAVGVTAVVLPDSARPPVRTDAAAPPTTGDWLLVAATASATAPDRTGAYWVYRSEEAEKDRPRMVIEQWLTTVDRKPSAAYLRDPATGRWSRRDLRGHSAANNFLLGGQGRSAREIAALPAGPDQLKAKLLSWYAAGDRSDFLFYAASALVLNLPARPEVRAAAYRMLAGVPGVTVLGPVTDAAGRSGIAVAIEHRGDGGARGQVRLIIDPASGAALAQERWTDGVRSSYTAVLSAGFTDDGLPSAGDIH